MKIIIDTQESKNGIVDYLKEKIDIEVKRLKVGDFLISKDVVVERKTVEDFVSSLIDGRLFKQAENMKENYSIPIFIIEGDPEDLFLRNISDNAIRSAMISLVLKKNIRYLFTSSYIETAKVLETLVRKEQKEEKKDIALRCKIPQKSLEEEQQFFLEGLPGIGPRLANSLLNIFGTPYNVLTASDEELKKVDKLGPKKIKCITTILKRKRTDNPKN